MLRIVFWILFCLEFLPAVFAAAAGVIGVLTGSSVNSMMLLIAPAGAVTLFLACIGVWFYFTNSKFALAVLLLPFLLIPVLYVQKQAGERWMKDAVAGNQDFKQPGKQRLANAIAADDLGAVKAAIPGAGDLKTSGESGLPMLLFALQTPPGKKPNPAIVAALLDAGADPNASRPDGTLPLDATKDFALIKLLIAHRADPNKKGKHGPVWFNAFGDMYSSTPDGAKIFDLYRAHGLRLEGVNSRGQGPIAAAAAGRDWHSLRIILESGADSKNVMIHTQSLSEYLRMAADAARSVHKVPEDLSASIALVDKR